jgi:hypothetical protein
MTSTSTSARPRWGCCSPSPPSAGSWASSTPCPENWIIQWERFIGPGGGKNKARRIDTKLTDGLFHLQNLQGQEETPADAARLAVRNLLRGYGLRLPTGQAVANRLGLPVLTASQLEAAASSPRQAQVLRSARFLERTPP